MKSVVRKAVLAYSVRNRQRKSVQMIAWMKRHHVREVLLVGTMGDERADSDIHTNAGIIENRIAEQYDIKMSINVDPTTRTTYPFMVADAREMPFPDNYVDFALANAIIEHVGQEPEQRKMVNEMTRVARSWIITTPNRWFPIESHSAVLLKHWLPSWRARRPESDFTRLLSKREFAALLPPGATIVGRPWSPTFTASYDRSAVSAGLAAARKARFSSDS